MRSIKFLPGKFTLLAALFILAFNTAIAQTVSQDNFTQLPWYKIPWLWLGILVILAAIILYVTFAKSK